MQKFTVRPGGAVAQFSLEYATVYSYCDETFVGIIMSLNSPNGSALQWGAG